MESLHASFPSNPFFLETMMRYLLGLVLLCLAVSQVEDADGIMILDEKTFHSAIKENDNLFLFFHSSVKFECVR